MDGYLQSKHRALITDRESYLFEIQLPVFYNWHSQFYLTAVPLADEVRRESYVRKIAPGKELNPLPPVLPCMLFPDTYPWQLLG